MRISLLLLLLWLAGVPFISTALSQETGEKTAPPPIVIPEFQRYQVSVRVALSPELRLNALGKQRLIDHILAANRRFWGGCWEVGVIHEHRLQPPTARHMADFTVEDVLAFESDLRLDKIFLVVVEPHRNSWRISARELDRRSRLLSSLKSLDAVDLREIPDLAARLCSELFRPIIRIEDVAGKTVYARLIGGALIPPDPNLALATAGSLWLPLSRSIPSKEMPDERVQLVPWTYLRMEAPPSLEETLCKCEVITGIRNPIPARRSIRVESIALAIRPTTDSTVVRLTSRGASKAPLAAYDVDLMNEEKQPTGTMLTDRRGHLSLTGTVDQPLKWLQVRSGQLKLVQLPIVPGVLPTADLEIPSDAPRLKVEAQLAVLQSQLMELVVQRALLMRHLKRATDDQQWDQIDPLVAEIKTLPTREGLRSEVSAIRVSEVKAAEENRDRISARRIEKICDETLELIDRHLDQEKVNDLIELSLQLRETDKKQLQQIENNPEMELKKLAPSK